MYSNNSVRGLDPRLLITAGRLQLRPADRAHLTKQLIKTLNMGGPCRPRPLRLSHWSKCTSFTPSFLPFPWSPVTRTANRPGLWGG